MSKDKYLENERFCREEALRPGANVEAWIKMAEQLGHDGQRIRQARRAVSPF